MSEGEYKFIITDYTKKRKVGWLTKSYLEHCKKHPDFLPHKLNDVKKTIQSPHLKGTGKGKRTEKLMREVRYDKSGHKLLYVETIIDYTHNPAHVKTAHLTPDTGDCSIVL
jgi:hypothetical protein